MYNDIVMSIPTFAISNDLQFLVHPTPPPILSCVHMYSDYAYSLGLLMASGIYRIANVWSTME